MYIQYVLYQAINLFYIFNFFHYYCQIKTLVIFLVIYAIKGYILGYVQQRGWLG